MSSTADFPGLKASYFAGNIDALDVLGSDADEARRRLAPILKEAAKLSRADWTPIAWDIAMTDVCCELGGLAAVRALNRRGMLASLDTPLIRPLITTSVNVFGLSPATFIRFLPNAWSAVTRHLGSITVSFSGPSAEIVFHGLPPETLTPRWLEGFCGLLEGVFIATRHEGEVPSPVIIDQRAHYRAAWRLRSSP